MDDTKVLCVENHLEYIDALKYVLKAAGCEVMPGTSGSQALHLLTTLHVDGLLLEYNLPDATGSAVRAEMKRIKPNVPVLLFSGIGSQTPFLLRFFDAYLRNSERPEEVFEDLDGRVGLYFRKGDDVAWFLEVEQRRGDHRFTPMELSRTLEES